MFKSSQNKNKVLQEEITKGSKFLHPKSRKCIALVKKMKWDSKKEVRKQDTKLKQALVAEKLLWIQKNMIADVCPYTDELTAELIEKYIARNDEELEQIKIKRSIGGNRNHQHIARENVIRLTKERERGDYETCGLEIPNILNTAQCTMLRKWNGNLKFLPNFKFCFFSKKHLDEKLKKKQKLELKENKSTENIEGTNNTIDDKDECKSDTLNNKSKSTECKDNSNITEESKESMDVE